MLNTVTVDPLLGTVLAGRYLLRECLEQRGMLRRYAAELETSAQPALATIISGGHLDGESGEKARERFFKVGARLKNIDHPACAPLVDFGSLSDGTLYSIEPGEVWHDLQREIELRGRFSATEAVELCRQLLYGLDHLHQQGIIHGSICPSVLRLRFAADGALRVQLSSSALTFLAANPLGIPEAVDYSGDGPPSIASDLRAAGAVLTKLLTGEELPDGDLVASVELPKQVLEVIGRAFGKRGAPFSSAQQMANALKSTAGRPRFGRYELVRKLAAGGMGEIMLARAEGVEGIEGLNRLCVLKTIRTSLASDEEFVTRFLAEARVIASLHHGNLVPVYDVGKVGDTFYIAMAYVAGKDLFAVLEEMGRLGQPMPIPLALYIAREVANGLAYAHRAKLQGVGGLVHRDISPQNILLSYEGEVKLIDFGLARHARDKRITDEGMVLGKVCYLSPEQARGATVDRRTDIYALGLVLFEMLAGAPFFNQPTFEAVMTAVADPRPQPPSMWVPEVPPEVDRIVLQAMAPNPADRYPAAEPLRDDLAAVLAKIAPRTNPEAIGTVVRELFPEAGVGALDVIETQPPVTIDQPIADALVTAQTVELEGASLRGRAEAPIRFAPTVVAVLGETAEQTASEIPPDSSEDEPVLVINPDGSWQSSEDHHQPQQSMDSGDDNRPTIRVDKALSPEEIERLLSPMPTSPSVRHQRPPPVSTTGPSLPPGLQNIGSIPSPARAQAQQPDYVRFVLVAFTLVLAALTAYVLWRERAGPPNRRHPRTQVARLPKAATGKTARIKINVRRDAAVAARDADRPADRDGQATAGQPTDVRALEMDLSQTHCFIDVVGPQGARVLINGRERGQLPLAEPLDALAWTASRVQLLRGPGRLSRPKLVRAERCSPGKAIKVKFR